MFGSNALKALENPVEFVKEKVAQAKTKLLTIDVNHNGIPDLTEIENDAHTLEADAQAIGLTKDEVENAIKVLFPKRGPEDIAKIEALFSKVTGLEARIAGVVSNAEAALK
jgi:hypothetical protein